MNPRFERLRKKSGGRNRRNRRQLGSTVKVWGGFAAAHHLGTKTKHDADVLRQRDWVLAQKARELGVSVKDLDDQVPIEEDLAKVRMPGDRDDSARMGEEVEQKDLDGLLGNSGLILSLAKVGRPGDREWKDLEGGPWVSQMMRHKTERSSYVTANRHHVKNGKRALEVMLARLPPWVALEMSSGLLADPSALREKVMDLAQNFSARYNVDVLGAVVHRESEYDLHIHLIFSRTREITIRKKASARLVAERRKIECDKIRTILKQSGKPYPNTIVSELLKEGIARGEIQPLDREEVIVENRRYDVEPDEPADGEEPPVLHRRCLGHAYRSKLEIWRAAAPEDRDAIAAQKDGNPLDPWSFRGGLIEPQSHGKSLEDIWWDLWTAGEWQRVCIEGSGKETLDRVAARGVAMAKDYLRFGSTVATTVERLAAEKKELQRRLEQLEARGSGDSAEKSQEPLRRLKLEFQKVEERASDLDSENANLRTQISEKEKHEGILHEVVADLRKKNKNISEQLAEAQRTASRLRSENDRLGMEILDKGAEVLRFQLENERRDEKAQDIEQQNPNLPSLPTDLLEQMNRVLDKVSTSLPGIEIPIVKRLEKVVEEFLASRRMLAAIGTIITDLGELPRGIPSSVSHAFRELKKLFGMKEDRER